jgi:DNA-binding CsgD family transcriptional regulator
MKKSAPSSAKVVKLKQPTRARSGLDFPTRRHSVSEQLMLGLTTLTGRVGKDDFYEAALETIGSLVSCTRKLMIRYGRFGKPEIVINTSMTESAKEFYLSKLYRLDPLLRLVNMGTSEGVLTFRELRKTEPDNLFFDELYSSARIYDELAIMLSAPGGVSIALCFDRSDRRFTQAETHRLRQIFPLLNAMHSLHMERSLLSGRSGFYSDTEFAVMATDHEGCVVLRNNKWETQVGQECETSILQLSQTKSNGDHFFELSENAVVWEKLDEDHAIIPGGIIHILETRQPGYIETNISNAIETFGSKYDLTNREMDIVSIAIKGYSNNQIAKELKISVGAIKNHRYRLYYKLDITSERELFHMFIQYVVSIGL